MSTSRETEDPESKNASGDLNVVVVAYRSLPVISPTRKGLFGGLETSAWLTAKALTKLASVRVTVVTRYQSRINDFLQDGVKIKVRHAPVEVLRESMSGQLTVVSSFPWLVIHRWRWSLLYQIPILAAVRMFSPNRSHELYDDPYFRGLNADVLCLFGVNRISARAILSVDSKRTKTVLLVRSNAELDERFYSNKDFRNQYGEDSQTIRYALENASDVVVQTDFQGKRLRQLTGRDALVLENPFDLESWDELSQQSLKIKEITSQRYMLWVGRPDRFHKRPHLILKLARLCPSIQFLMVLNRVDGTSYDEILASQPENVTVIEQVPFRSMPALFANSSGLLFTGTQEHEGLPNVLLQAAASGKPIIAYDYLPEVIQNNTSGVVTGDIKAMSKVVQQVWDDADLAEELGKKGRDFMEQRQDLNEYARQLASVFQKAR